MARRYTVDDAVGPLWDAHGPQVGDEDDGEGLAARIGSDGLADSIDGDWLQDEIDDGWLQDAIGHEWLADGDRDGLQEVDAGAGAGRTADSSVPTDGSDEQSFDSRGPTSDGREATEGPRDARPGAARPEPPVDWRVAEGPTVGEDLLPDHEFALCLTHDVDRPFKRVQAIYYALRDHDPRQLRALLPGREPNWQFESIRQIERELGVRSAFYFLDEQRLLRDRPAADWFDPEAWQLFADRYSVRDPRIAAEVRRLRAGGWELGLHGSYESCTDRERLDREKTALETVLGDAVAGGRQHYLKRRLPETWRHQRAVGLQYDATLGSAETVGFQFGDTVGRPFDDDFVVFPLTMMEHALPDPARHPERAWEVCADVLEEAAERGAVATVLWHPRTFNERDWPGYASLYRRLLRYALDLGAWVGPPGDLYDVVQREAERAGEEPRSEEEHEDAEAAAPSEEDREGGSGDVDSPGRSANRSSERHGARPGTAED